LEYGIFHPYSGYIAIVSYRLCKFQVGIDMVGKLPKTADGNQYIITLMDYFSKWPEAEAVKSKSAETIALFLYKVICQYV